MVEKQKEYHFIYKITNLVNEKFYVGMHSTNKLDDGYFGSGTRIKYSIKKHGVNNHKMEILEFLPSREALRIREGEIVNKELLSCTKCMNLVLGGGGIIFLTDESRSKMSTFAKQRKRVKHSDDTIRKMSKAKIGKFHSDETKRKISETKAGKGLTVAHKEAITASLSRPEIKEKISKALIGAKGHHCRQVSVFGVDYPDIGTASKETGISYGALVYRIRSINPHHDNYQYKGNNLNG